MALESEPVIADPPTAGGKEIVYHIDPIMKSKGEVLKTALGEKLKNEKDKDARILRQKLTIAKKPPIHRKEGSSSDAIRGESETEEVDIADPTLDINGLPARFPAYQQEELIPAAQHLKRS